MLDCLKKEILSHSKEYCDEHGEAIYNIMKSLLQDFNTCYRRGLVALRKKTLKVDNADYQSFMNMVIEGFTVEEIENIAISRFYERNLSGYEAYLYYIFASTAINLAAGYFSYLLVKFFVSVTSTSSSIFKQIESLEDIRFSENFGKTELLLKEKRYAELFDYRPQEDNFSKIIVQLSDRNIQRMLRDCDQVDLAIALKFSTAETITKIFKNLSHIAACMLSEDLELTNCTENESLEKKKKIISTILGTEIESIKITNAI